MSMWKWKKIQEVLWEKIGVSEVFRGLCSREGTTQGSPQFRNEEKR